MVVGCAVANNGDKLGMGLFITYMARTKCK